MNDDCPKCGGVGKPTSKHQGSAMPYLRCAKCGETWHPFDWRPTGKPSASFPVAVRYIYAGSAAPLPFDGDEPHV